MWWRLNHTNPSNHTIHYCNINNNNRNYNTRRGRWVFWESWLHSIKHFVFPDCASEVLKGSKKHEDIPHGSLATISCTGGCIHFTKVNNIIRANLYFSVICKLNQDDLLPLKYFLLVGWHYKFAKYRPNNEMVIFRPCLDVTILKQQWIPADHRNKSMRNNWSSWKESAKAKNLALPRLATAGGIRTSIAPLMSQPSCGCIIIAMVFQAEL